MKKGVNKSEKKIICFYATATDLGGAEKSLLELVKGLKEDLHPEWYPRVLLPKKTGALVEELERNQIECTVVELPESFLKLSRSRPLYSIFKLLQSIPEMIIYFFKASEEIKKMDSQLIHTTGLKCHFLGLFFAKKNRIPILWHLRDIFEPGFTLGVLRVLLRRNSIAVVCNSRATAAPFGGSGLAVHVVYNGLNPADYYPQPNAQYREHFQVGEDTAIVGIVGAFASWKGQSQFLRAASLLVDRGVRVRFVIVGDEIYDTGGEKGLMQKYQQESRDLGLEKIVYFPGFDRSAPRVMNALQILVHASIRPEPFGRVIVEAMACGTAVVASKWGAASEFFIDHKNGLLINPKNPEEIADAVEWLILNRSEMKKMQLYSRDVFLSRFTSDRYVAEMKNMFNLAAKS